VRISKLEAALRQLEAAVNLFFEDGDRVPIHTLAAASRSVLNDLSRAEGREAGLDAIFVQLIRPEKLGEVQGLLRQAQNFFKHADKDPDTLLDFNPTMTEILLWDACVLYETLTNTYQPLTVLFRVWFTASHPEILMPETRAQLDAMKIPYDLANLRLFFEEMLPLTEEWIPQQPPPLENLEGGTEAPPPS
jgi:hypothetical protein